MNLRVWIWVMVNLWVMSNYWVQSMDILYPYTDKDEKPWCVEIDGKILLGSVNKVLPEP